MRALIFLLAVLVAFPALAAGKFTLSSSTFRDKQTLPPLHVFNGFGCSGQNVSPALTWTDPPAGTKSLAITLYDPDAPTGSGWWHWTVFNLPAATRSLSQGVMAGKGLDQNAVMGRTDFGGSAFGGACPPKGDKPHRYILTLWALKIDRLPLDQNASGAMVGYYLNANKLATSTLTATYGR